MLDFDIVHVEFKILLLCCCCHHFYCSSKQSLAMLEIEFGHDADASNVSHHVIVDLWLLSAIHENNCTWQ
jgi:hypothetical protein